MKNFDEEVQRLLEIADSCGVFYTDVLDEAVHDTASEQASSINNQGMEEQIKYLLTYSMTPERVEELLKAEGYDRSH